MLTASALLPDDLPEIVGVPLSAEQLAAATAELEPGLIVAGAGSGKTTVMAARAVWLVATGQVEPAGLLGLTFTNKAAAELLHRLRGALRTLSPALSKSADDAVVCTYHAFAGQILREFGMLIGVEPGAELMSAVRQRQLAFRVASRADVHPGSLHTSVGELASSIIVLDSLLADAGVPLEELAAFDDAAIASLESRDDQQRTGQRMLAAALSRRDLVRLLGQFRRKKGDRGLLDFADVVRLSSQLAGEHPQVGALLRQRHPAVMLDEYQDTSVAQRLMLQALFAHGHPVTAVGDPCQAIYGWRGASPYNIDGFPTHFPTADGQPAPVRALATNRRSGAHILGLANAIAEPLRRLHPDVVRLRADPDRGPGQVECALLPTADEELAWVTDRLAVSGVPWRDIAVLARTNGDVTAVAAALRRARIPLKVVGKQALLALPEVRWIVWAMRLIADPTANDALAGLLSGPPWRIGQRDLALVAVRADELSGRARTPSAGTVAGDLLASLGADPGDGPCLLDALHDPGPPQRYPYSDEARQRMARAAALLDGWQRRAAGAVPDLVRAIAEESGLAVELNLGVATSAPGRPMDDGGLVGLIDLARRFDDLEGGSTLGDFLAWIRVAGELTDGPQALPSSTTDAVTVMTVHAAKGLEYPIVVVPGLVDGGFPSDQGRGNWATNPLALPGSLVREPVAEALLAFPVDPGYPRAKEYAEFAAANRDADRIEEVRLAYVAVTRAKQRLLLSGHRWGRTQARPRSPSPFLLAAADGARAGHGEIDVWTLPPDEGAENPMLAPRAQDLPEPIGEAPDWGRIALAMEAVADPGPTGDDVVAGWDRDLQTLRAELSSRGGQRTVEIEPDLSVSRWLAWARDPQAFALDVLRPVPPPASLGAQAGEQFHEWAADQGGQLAMWDEEDLFDDGPPADWRAAFAASPLAGLTPIVVEHAVAVPIGGTLVRGRIDAVFEVDGEHWVVDWKTGSPRGADPLQLALYAAAWAQERGVPHDRVVGCFVFVAERRCDVYRELPTVDRLQAALGGATLPMAPSEAISWEV